jgi:hypothetical protein
VVGGSLVSGGLLAQAIKSAAHSSREPWKSLGENYAHWIASFIAAALYWTSAAVMRYWGPRQFAKDCSRLIEVCRAKEAELEAAKAEVIHNESLDPDAKDDFVVYLDQQLRLNTAQRLLALSSNYPTRLWEAPNELLSKIEERAERKASG